VRGAARPGLPVVESPVVGSPVVESTAVKSTVVKSTVVKTAAGNSPGAARAALAAAAALGAYQALRRYPPAGESTWARTNHRGEPVTLLEGPALAAGAVAAQVITAAVTAPGGRRPVAAVHHPERERPFASPLAVAGLGAVAFGLVDDLRGSGQHRGLRGHLGALARGEVTTGTVKLAGLAATGLGAALLEGGDPADVVVNAGLIAGGANLLNLFDLRPGRAIKVAALSAGLIAGGSALAPAAAAVSPGAGGLSTGRPGAGGPSVMRPGAMRPTAGRPSAMRPGAGRLAGLRAVAAPTGAALALLSEDLGERAMLGDAGANALGAMLGAAAAQALPRSARLGLLAGIVALTAASEKVSFTRVIAATPPLHWLDMLGRRPAPLTAPVTAAQAGGPHEAGPDLDGPALTGTALNGTALNGTALNGTALNDTAVEGPALTGIALARPRPAAEPAGAGLSGAERLAWWLRRRRPGRHRRTKAAR
jgi:UDP-GlcNAc:undecaprenyl-phosphate GlcNAc-1-phosphate transferase